MQVILISLSLMVRREEEEEERSEGKSDESKLLFSSLLSWLKSLNLSKI